MISLLKFARTYLILIVFAFCAMVATVQAQNEIANLRSFDSRLMHYGIQVGYSQSKFDISFSEDEAIRELMRGVRSYYAAGFHISVIADMRLGNYFNLRALPGIVLLTRHINYMWDSTYASVMPLIENSRSVESVYGEIPLELKFRAWRYNNFRPYLTAGGSYAFDFASLRKNRNNNNESIVRLGANNICYSLGVGVDVFLRYVKFAIDLKMSFGVVDLLIADDELYTQSINSLRTRSVMLSFTFEG